MINVIDLNVLNFFYNLSNKQFYFLNQFMIFLTFLGDDGNIFILLSIILLFFKKIPMNPLTMKKAITKNYTTNIIVIIFSISIFQNLKQFDTP